MPIEMSINRSPVCRRLQFDDEDDVNPNNNSHLDEEITSQNNANILSEELKRSREEKSRKWNFDFQNERPLEGEYEWEIVMPEPNINVSSLETQQNRQNDLTEAMDCDVNVTASDIAVTNESSTNGDILVQEQMTTPTKQMQ